MHGARRGPNTRALGFREIATPDAQLLLNGNPIFLLAALDQDLHPDTVYTVPLTSCVTSFRRPTISGFNCLVVRSNCQTSGTSDSGLKLVAIASAWVVALADTTARDTDYIMRRLMRRRRNSPRGSGAMANGGWRAPAMIQSTTIAFVVS